MYNFEYKKSLGQNFIKDDNIINKIVKSSELDKKTLLLEIGPGSGSLSKKTIPLCGYAIVYEIDKRLENILKKQLANYENYEVIFDDFLTQDISNLRNKYNYEKIYVVANLPYYITTPIVTKLMNELYPDKMILMVQEEVANRLSAKNGSKEYGMISVLLGSKYNVKKLFKVSKNCFIPSPKVDSAVIEMKKNNMIDCDIKGFESFIKAAFQFKRKNLKNNLKQYNLDKIQFILNKYGFSLANRSEDISIEVFVKLVKELYSIDKKG